MSAPYWETKSLGEMTREEWERLCDGCGRCCIHILHNEETGDIFETDVACKLFVPQHRRCKDYDNRTTQVPDCVRLTPENVAALSWMPESCAYRRLSEGRGLAPWHPLISGDPESIVAAGIAVSSDLIGEESVDLDDLDDHIVRQRS